LNSIGSTWRRANGITTTPWKNKRGIIEASGVSNGKTKEYSLTIPKPENENNHPLPQGSGRGWLAELSHSE